MSLSAKERMAIPRHSMPEQPGEVRRGNFQEVNLGYTAELAKLEALRCLQCPKPSCTTGCPVGVKIRDFIGFVAAGDLAAAAAKLHEDNALPAVCGRVCPQEKQCEGNCSVGKKAAPVAIGYLERFVADWERENLGFRKPEMKPATGKKIAVVGSGPAGLSCAGDLIQMGHSVTVFEALHELGGVLRYGIPEFRLPKEIVAAEVNSLAKLGVEFQTNVVIGRTFTIDDLLEQYDAVFVGVGAGLPVFLDIPGEHLNGVYTANEFLTRVNLMKAWRFPEVDTPICCVQGSTVAVIGGGNTAMDASRTAVRMGAERVVVVYRRSEEEMPARLEEVKHAQEEGVEFQFLAGPVEFLGDDQGSLIGMRMQQMELGAPDASGRRKPVPIPGALSTLPVQIAVVALGNGANPILEGTTPDLQFTRRGTVTVDLETMKTSKEGVFAGGDIVTGGATVILAMGAGRKAAAAIDAYVRENP